jgi:hypothetical protein
MTSIMNEILVGFITILVGILISLIAYVWLDFKKRVDRLLEKHDILLVKLEEILDQNVQTINTQQRWLENHEQRLVYVEMKVKKDKNE